MKLSLIIPAHNEEGCIEETLNNLIAVLRNEQLDFDILVINDNSTDDTEILLQSLCKQYSEVNYMNNVFPQGFGYAIQYGLTHYKGDAVAIVMADGSDAPEDVVQFFRKLCEGYDSIFGSRFIKGGGTRNYPFFKLLLNRIVNTLIQILFGIKYNDVTNAFKMYRRTTINGLKPFLSAHFNLTVELPLKTITRGHTYAVLPNTWINRQAGESKLKIKEMGSRYLFVIFYCLLEKWLTLGDYKKGKFLSSSNQKTIES